MSYVIDWSSGGSQGIPGKDAIILNAKSYNSTSTSLTLTGKGVENYGEIQQENFIRLLENFASNVAPPNPTIGQLWFKANESTLYAWGPGKSSSLLNTGTTSTLVTVSSAPMVLTANIVLQSSGALNGNNNVDGAVGYVVGSWLNTQGAGLGSGWYVRARVSSGPNLLGSLADGAWHQLSTNMDIIVQSASSTAHNTGEIYFEFSASVSGIPLVGFKRATFNVGFTGVGSTTTATTLTPSSLPTSWIKASGNTAGDIILALGYNPFGNSTSSNPLTTLDITTALGYTPLNKNGGTMTSALDAGGFKITHVATPTVSTDAATMGYVTSTIASSMNSLPLSQGSGINVTNLGGPTTPDYRISNTGVISLTAGTNTTVTNNGNGSWSVNAPASSTGTMTGLVGGTNITSVVNNNNGTWTINATTQTTSSVQTVTSGGTVTTGALSASTGTFSGTLSTTGGANLSISGAITAVGDITSTSDAKLKKDLEKIDCALDRVDLLTGYTFTRIDTGRRQAGLIAQDVQKVLPEAVMEGEYLSVAYGNMMGLIVEAIKELRTEVEAIKAKL